MGSFWWWWEGYKSRLARNGTLPNLPGDFEEFVQFVGAQPLSLKEKKEIVRNAVKVLQGIAPEEFKRKQRAKLRRAGRYYHVYFKNSQVR